MSSFHITFVLGLRVYGVQDLVLLEVLRRNRQTACSLLFILWILSVMELCNRNTCFQLSLSGKGFLARCIRVSDAVNLNANTTFSVSYILAMASQHTCRQPPRHIPGRHPTFCRACLEAVQDYARFTEFGVGKTLCHEGPQLLSSLFPWRRLV